MKMASATRTWAMVNKHVPMIKFRRASAGSHEHGAVVQPVSATKTMNLDKSSTKPTLTIILEDWQLTGKYKRKPISQEEIDFINRGGPQ
ncbi:putative 28S ribosomal protein S36 [Daphnia sinensis]|uniref:28S ribosomal protein S36 n=1 Tax=Daphnia sinensis TaxID=1820382 RepID=A0AAD5KRJ0_9CRUS|nr:putative 28S ribosomal protein S36 [Daphnia sinensis]